MSQRETELLMRMGAALKQAGLLDPELPPTEMVLQASILLKCMLEEGIEITMRL